MIKKKNSRCKTGKKFTFIIIPPGTEKTRRFNLPKKAIIMVLSLVFTAAVASGAVTYLYYSSQGEIKNIQNLKKEKEQKEQMIEYLKNEIDSLAEQQNNIDDKQRQLKKMMGIQTEETVVQQPSRGGQGGSNAIRLDANLGTMAKLIKVGSALDREEKELDELIAKVNNNREYFLSIPNLWPVTGDITSTFGWRKSPFGGRSQSFHNGTDIANNTGTNIMAAADGTVTKVGWQGAYGRTIEIDHGYGFVTMYAHNSEILVKTGEKVKKGQVISKLGNTGRSTGPHLHFSIFKNGQALDPMIYLP